MLIEFNRLIEILALHFTKKFGVHSIPTVGAGA
jgi:hypothetical protein